jgi:hypothetical protein
VVPVVGSKQEIKRRLIMIKQQRHGSIGAGLATALAVAALACATFTRAQDVIQESGSGAAEWITLNNGIRPAAPDVAAPDSVEGQLRSEGRIWQRAPGPIWVGTYVQDILAGRLDQPKGRGTIGKVLSVGEYIGMEHAWVDLGRGCIEHIRASELCPIRFVASERPGPGSPVPMPGQARPGLSVSDLAAPDSVEGQFRSEGKRWVRIPGPIHAGIYAQDIWPNRLNQPAGRGLIGKVVDMRAGADGRSRAVVDFGRGYVVDVFPQELSPIRFVAAEMPDSDSGFYRPGLVRPSPVAPDVAAPDSIEGQLRSEGQRWTRTGGPIQAGTYVQDILVGRLDQPAGRGAIGKVASVFVNQNGRDCAAVDFGRGYVADVFQSELSPVRILPSDLAAADSVEGQLRAKGEKWERTRAQISAGSYVMDILQGRLNQPAGRGVIGKVVSIVLDEQGRAVVNLDFGRGWVVWISISELAPIRFVAPPIPSAGDAPSVEGQPESGLLRDSATGQSAPYRTNPTEVFYIKTVIDQQSGQYAIVNSNRTAVIMKDNAGGVLWSTNVISAWKAHNPQTVWAGEFIINSMKMADGGLVVGFTGGTASIDKQTGAVKFLGSD